ncbi:transcriptional adapter 1 [Leptinotarsa decemlineata]|uniref:transcriptional adapter 1 n=1 Tax=Leptinotarsa decemlineata TaxID=7539 RepID=UPI000C253136|nr:transcriptional adapter 1-like [Leptinotarsa decemlineata]
MDLNEARKDLEACLNEDLKKEYFSLLRQWFLFTATVTKEEFDKGVRKLLTSEDQIRCHNHFLLAILTKISSNSRPKAPRSNTDRGIFECADYADYVQPSSPTMTPRPDFENRSAAAELFIPDSGFIACRVAIAAWENGMEGAEESVTELMVHACQVFVKNLITAMISRKKGYKVRDRKFQYGFNLPVPDPFTRNFNNIIDDTQESKVEVANGDDTFRPKCKVSLENMEQQVAFSYSCAKRTAFNNTLTVRLLYDTIRENPKILGLHTIHSVNLFRLGLLLDEDSTE